MNERSEPSRYDSFDLLATMVAVVQPDGTLLFVNAMFENVAGLSRRTLMRSSLFDWFVDAHQLRETVAAVRRNEIATGRFESVMRRAPVAAHEQLPVHVIVTQIEHGSDRVLVEMLEIEQQTRQDREERALGQAQANKELIRNLAHEIKNPLGGIRGAAQLLAMELTSRELTEYTRVIIHEVCERVRSLILAEFPRGLAVQRDYDISIPDFRGDREQLIQAVLNIAHNAAQALQQRIADGDAVLILRTRVSRQVTIGKQRFRLALELHIENNGPGVPEDIRERIFYPLVSGREGGSGLGLTLAQTFVQQHQGMIECDSEPGRTIFRIVIPLP